MKNSIQGDSIPEKVVFGVMRTSGETDKDVALVFTQVDPDFSSEAFTAASLLLESSKVVEAATILFDESMKKAADGHDKKAAEMEKNI